MKVWHKIVAAPGVAIIFLILLGAAAYAVVVRRHTATDDMFKHRFAGYRMQHPENARLADEWS